ncbi:Histidine decarboxylase [Portunus trituberculatus]|uniref:Aromatic-L-amino-acid decarboxylase n=1 Tax=Portunus trituberculatus TaxID=210409 RepID=A0A5B7JFZ4_PORTR|nr:Histidine decarboxylase [Portunus trituberculatus]
MVEYIADYLENIRERRVFPDVKPGYMRDLMPDEAPEQPEPWQNIFNDIERVVMPGVSCVCRGEGIEVREGRER